MKSTPAAPGPPINSIDTEETGLPGLRTWRNVYLLVLGMFVLWVVLLEALEMVFS
jgi:hypothetical protein